MCIRDYSHLNLVAGEQTKDIVFRTSKELEQHRRIAIGVRKVTNRAESLLTQEATLHPDCRNPVFCGLTVQRVTGR